MGRNYEQIIPPYLLETRWFFQRQCTLYNEAKLYCQISTPSSPKYSREVMFSRSIKSEIQSTYTDMWDDSETMYLNINISHLAGKSPNTSIARTKPFKHLHVMTRDPSTYVHRQIISPSYGLSSSQLKQMIFNSINASTDEMRNNCTT